MNYSKTNITPDLIAVMKLVNNVKKTANIDYKRVYVMGLSMSGMGTFEIVHIFPKCFTAAVPIYGAGHQEQYTNRA